MPASRLLGRSPPHHDPLPAGVDNPPESSPTSSVRQDLTRTTLAVICLLLLIGTTLWVLRPFLAAGVWATMLVVSTWPLLKSLQARLGNRRAPAVALMTLGLLLLLILPLWAAIDTIARHADEVTALAKTVAESGLPQPPEWVRGVPVVGEKVAAAWADTAQAGLTASSPAGAARLGRRGVGARPRRQRGRHAGPLPPGRDPLRHPVRRRRNGGESGAPFRPATGGRARRELRRPGRAGHSGRALGVGVTAVVQTVLGGLGLAVAGVPFAGFLSAVMLILCIAQLGPALVLFPAVAWMYWSGRAPGGPSCWSGASR